MRSPGSLLFVLLATNAGGQQLLEGRVLDKETREPVIGAHVIGVGSKSSGSSTNTDGIFSLHWEGRLDSIRVSCIGYSTVSLPAKEIISPVVVSMVPRVVSLDALTVSPPSPLQLLRKAVLAIPRNYHTPPFQLRGFYREIIRRESTYYSVAEAIFESQLPEAGDDKALLKLVQGRRSESVQSTRIFEDFHPGGGPNYLMNHLPEVNLPEFLQESNLDDYVFTVDSITSYENRDVYMIGFDQRDGLKKNLWAGKIFLDAESLAIVELTFALSRKGIEYRKHLSGTDRIMAGVLGIDYTVLGRATRYSYRRDADRWQLHDAALTLDIHFIQPRKKIDEAFTLQAQLLALGRSLPPLTPFPRNEAWRKNQLVKNLPGEFDERFWGSNNFIRPESSLTQAVAAMDILRRTALTPGVPEGWNFFHPEEASVYQQQQALLLKPFAASRWKDESKGPFLWKPVQGDFELTAMVRVTQSSDTTAVPNAGFQAGGLMIRVQQEQSEDHVLLAIGCMGNPQLKILAQHTAEANSRTQVTRTEQNEYRLRLRRVGDRAELSYRVTDEPWTLLQTYTLSGWPAEVQAGIAGFTYVTGGGPNRRPDLLIKASDIRVIPLKP